MQRVKQVETITGNGRVRLTDRTAAVNYVIRVFQEFDDEVPLLKNAKGRLNLPHGDVAHAMMDRDPIQLLLQDGRAAKILFIDLDGNFQVTGPIA